MAILGMAILVFLQEILQAILVWMDFIGMELLVLILHMTDWMGYGNWDLKNK